MCAWLLSAGELVQPLVDLMSKQVRESKVIHTDDTRVPVQDETLEGKCKSGRIWTYIGDRDHPYIVYDYTPDRTRAGPSKWLDKFKGYLQADAYGGYDGIRQTPPRRRERAGEGSRLVGPALAAATSSYAKDTDGGRGQMRHVRSPRAQAKRAPRIAREQADAIRLALRQSKSVPILATIKTWLDTEQKLVLPRSPMGAGHRPTCSTSGTRCASITPTQGFLNIDNNAAERALRRVGIGRKNWLFAGHDVAAQRIATLYSLIASAERHGLDPHRYLTRRSGPYRLNAGAPVGDNSCRIDGTRKSKNERSF